MAEPSQERKAITYHRDGDLFLKFNAEPFLATPDCPEMAKRLDCLMDFIDSWSLLLGHGQKLLSGLFAGRARLMAKGVSGLRMHRIDQCLSQFPGYSSGEDCVNIE